MVQAASLEVTPVFFVSHFTPRNFDGCYSCVETTLATYQCTRARGRFVGRSSYFNVLSYRAQQSCTLREQFGCAGPARERSLIFYHV